MTAGFTEHDRPSGLQIGRGGFLRRASDDTPYVTDPGGELVKAGDRAGQPKRIAYGSPSSFGKLIENTYNLQKWGERMTVTGIGVDPEIAADCARIASLELDTDEWRTEADSVVVAAKRAAKASIAADRGTHAHELAEIVDDGRSIVDRIEAGEELGLAAEVQHALTDAWERMLVDNALEVLSAEASCVHDGWRLAGTLDRVVRLGRELRFTAVGGEILALPAGIVVVLDIKSGKLQRERNGHPKYWHGYAVQIAAYAGSVPYDTETEARGEWPWAIDQRRALIAHLDVLGAMAGDANCSLVAVDLDRGRHAAELCVAAKQWAKAHDVFTISQLEALDGVGSATIEPDAAPAIPPAVAQRDLTPQQQVAAIDRGSPDEGGDADGSAFDALQRRYMKLSTEGRCWLAALTEEAMHACVGFHSRGQRTVRRFEIIRGLVTLAEVEPGHDELLRALVATILGDAARFPAVTVGRAVGTLTASEAALFSHRCDLYVAGEAAMRFDASSAMHLAFDHAA